MWCMHAPTVASWRQPLGTAGGWGAHAEDNVSELDAQLCAAHLRDVGLDQPLVVVQARLDAVCSPPWHEARQHLHTYWLLSSLRRDPTGQAHKVPLHNCSTRKHVAQQAESLDGVRRKLSSGTKLGHFTALKEVGTEQATAPLNAEQKRFPAPSMDTPRGFGHAASHTPPRGAAQRQRSACGACHWPPQPS